MADFYEFHINELCKKYNQRQLAEHVTNYIHTNDLLRKDNEELRKENESLLYLIAKYQIEKN